MNFNELIQYEASNDYHQEDQAPGKKKYKYKHRVVLRDEVVGIGTWVGISILLGLVGVIPRFGPIITIVILLIMAFGDFNQNIKNWAKSILIIGIVALFIVFALRFLIII